MITPMATACHRGAVELGGLDAPRTERAKTLLRSQSAAGLNAEAAVNGWVPALDARLAAVMACRRSTDVAFGLRPRHLA